MNTESKLPNYLKVLLFTLIAVFIWSGIEPKDRFTWWLEIFPVIIALAIIIPTFKRFPLTPLLYCLLWGHCVILLVGGHYTYAEVPLFNYIRDIFEQSRNNYDKLGHLAQGFVPAILGRELLLRTSPLKPGKWLNAIIILSVLGVSAGYELLEWQVSVHTGSAGNDFLGTQGDIWDTQKDMASALIGSCLALLTLSKLHDRQLARLAA